MNAEVNNLQNIYVDQFALMKNAYFYHIDIQHTLHSQYFKILAVMKK